MKNIDNLIPEIRKKGMKATPQRVAICRYLYNNKTHPSADGIYNSLKRRYPTISLNTIYKTLELLVNIGEIQRLTFNPYKNNYDSNTDQHHHLICKDCSKIIDIQYDFTKSFSLPAKLIKKYKVNKFQIAFQGLCEKCQVN